MAKQAALRDVNNLFRSPPEVPGWVIISKQKSGLRSEGSNTYVWNHRDICQKSGQPGAV